MDAPKQRAIKAEPEFVICHNDDDVEIAHDPFAQYDVPFEIKSETQPKEEEEDDGNDYGHVIECDVDFSYDNVESDGVNHSGGEYEYENDDKPFVATSSVAFNLVCILHIKRF